MKSKILVLFLFLSQAQASFYFRQGIQKTQSKEIWKATKKEQKYSSANMPDATVNSYELSSYLEYFLNSKQSLAGMLSYGYSKISDGNQGDATKGAKVSGLKEFSLFYKHELLTFSNWYKLKGKVGYVQPFDSSPEKPAFLAITDFSEKIILGLEESLHFGSLNLYFYFDYILRASAPADQLSLNFTTQYSLNQKFAFGATLLWLHTLSGPDIGTPEWVQAVSAYGLPPFFLVRERFWSGSAFVQYFFKKNQFLDVSYAQKFWGRNTDKSNTYSLGYNFLF